MNGTDRGEDLGSRLPIAEEAAAWMLALKDAGALRSDKERFISWLKRSPVHVQEFLRVSALDAELAGRRLGFDADALLAECRRLSSLELVTPLERGLVAAVPRRNGVWSRPALVAALVAVAIIAVAMSIGLASRSRTVYTTERGEQRVVSLTDGSLMELNTQTRAQVAYDKATRRIILRDGDALFIVARNPRRPFVVEAGGQSIRATGTRFNVSARALRTVVTVIEGSVVVASTRPSEPTKSSNEPSSGLSIDGSSTAVNAGEQLVTSDRGAAQVHAVDAGRAMAWQEWKLYFDEETLASAVAEFNRYNRRQLSIDDPKLARRRISGVFFANQPDSLLAFISSRDAVDITRDRNGSRTIRLRKNTGVEGPAR